MKEWLDAVSEGLGWLLEKGSSLRGEVGHWTGFPGEWSQQSSREIWKIILGSWCDSWERCCVGLGIGLNEPWGSLPLHSVILWKSASTAVLHSYSMPISNWQMNIIMWLYSMFQCDNLSGLWLNDIWLLLVQLNTTLITLLFMASICQMFIFITIKQIQKRA